MNAPAIPDYASDAPHYTAWAGDGPHANRVYASNFTVLVELRNRYNTAVHDLVLRGETPADAMVLVDVEGIAERVA